MYYYQAPSPSKWTHVNYSSETQWTLSAPSHNIRKATAGPRVTSMRTAHIHLGRDGVLHVFFWLSALVCPSSIAYKITVYYRGGLKCDTWATWRPPPGHFCIPCSVSMPSILGRGEWQNVLSAPKCFMQNKERPLKAGGLYAHACRSQDFPLFGDVIASSLYWDTLGKKHAFLKTPEHVHITGVGCQQSSWEHGNLSTVAVHRIPWRYSIDWNGRGIELCYITQQHPFPATNLEMTTLPGNGSSLASVVPQEQGVRADEEGTTQWKGQGSPET